MTATYPAVCDEIATAIDQQGWGTKARLARDVGVQPTSVGRWYEGLDSPKPGLWPAIEASLGMDDGRLRTVAGNPPRRADDAMEKRMARLERRFAKMEKQLAELLQIAAR